MFNKHTCTIIHVFCLKKEFSSQLTSQFRLQWDIATINPFLQNEWKILYIYIYLFTMTVLEINVTWLYECVNLTLLTKNNIFLDLYIAKKINSTYKFNNFSDKWQNITPNEWTTLLMYCSSLTVYDKVH